METRKEFVLEEADEEIEDGTSTDFDRGSVVRQTVMLESIAVFGQVLQGLLVALRDFDADNLAQTENGGISTAALEVTFAEFFQ
ncbi:hypothetical protein GA0115239_103740 [Streptomyces sp. BpilaLS-43]|nr:hypothetical protein GA0115239_103740 [Streptomyces sp. BpilaLS-43]